MIKYSTTVLIFIFISFNLFASSQLDSLKQIIDSYESTCDLPCEADSVLIKSLISYGFLNEGKNNDSAVIAYQKAADLAHGAKLPILESKALSYIGIVKWNTGDYEKALENSMAALKIREQIGNKVLVAFSHNNIGLVYYSMGLFDEASEHYRNSLGIYRDLENRKGESASYTNIGLVKRYQGEHDSSIYYYEKSLQLDRENDDQQGMAYCYNNLGNVARDKSDFGSALDYFSKGALILDSLNEPSSVSVIYGNMAYCYNQQNKYNKSIKILEEAIKLNKTSGSYPQLQELYQHLSEAQTGLGKHQEAFESYKLYIEVKDSVFQLERIKKVEELRAQYESEKQARLNADLKKENAENLLKIEKQDHQRNFLIWCATIAFIIGALAIIALLMRRRRNRILASKNEQIIRQKLKLSEALSEVNELNEKLENSNRSKDKFFSILAHDLKGPVLSIKQAITMVHDHYDSFSAEEIKNYLNKLKGSSERANNLLVNLLDWSLSQKGLISFTPEENNLTDMLDQNIQLKKSIAEQKGIKINFNVEQPLLVKCDFGMINTVIRNLVSNALKFTPEGGEVTVILESKPNSVQFCVKDNGLGMSHEKINSLFKIDQSNSEKGTQGEVGTGLGLILCHEFIDKHNGTITVNSQEGEGTEFCVELPVIKEEDLIS